MIEVAPNVWINPPPRRLGESRVQRYRLCNDGQARWVDEDDWQRLTPENTVRLKLGIDYASLRLLCIAGLVRSIRPVPRATSFSIQSYFAHCDAIQAAADAGVDFWNTERLAALRGAKNRYSVWKDRDQGLAADASPEPRQARPARRPPSDPTPAPAARS